MKYGVGFFASKFKQFYMRNFSEIVSVETHSICFKRVRKAWKLKSSEHRTAYKITSL